MEILIAITLGILVFWFDILRALCKVMRSGSG